MNVNKDGTKKTVHLNLVRKTVLDTDYVQMVSVNAGTSGSELTVRLKDVHLTVIIVEFVSMAAVNANLDSLGNIVNSSNVRMNVPSMGSAQKKGNANVIWDGKVKIAQKDFVLTIVLEMVSAPLRVCASAKITGEVLIVLKEIAQKVVLKEEYVSKVSVFAHPASQVIIAN